MLRLFGIAVLWAVSVGPAAAAPPEPNQTAVERIALIAGSNAAPDGRQTLRYAESDAHRMSGVLLAVGGLELGNQVLVYDATPKRLARGFQRVARRARESVAAGRRVEFVLYFSGHSDEQGLLLGEQRVEYRTLHKWLKAVPADVRIVILDSCASGAFTRVKGGKRAAPFLVDAGVKIQGHAYLTSSSADENAQEADRIGGSYFTHFLTSGLRGAADSDGDNLVTLDEAYRFAFEETLAHTETSRAGAQHAAYDIDLSGSGDLVMTDLRRTTGRMVIKPQITGRVSVRSTSGRYVAELRMPPDAEAVVLALEPGSYTVTADNGRRLTRAIVAVPKSGHVTVTRSLLHRIGRDKVTTRGADGPPEYLHVPFNVGLMPALSVGGKTRPTITHFGAALLWSHSARTRGIAMAIGADVTDEEVRGTQWTVGASISRGNVIGAQLSAGFNWASTDVRGAQLGVAFNGTPQIEGAQVSSGFNWAQEVRGAQLGLVNVAKDVKGVQVGLVNYAQSADASIGVVSVTKEGGVHPEVWTSETAALNVGIRLPARYTYSSVSAGLHPVGSGRGWQVGIGLGGHIPLSGAASLDIDITGYTIFSGLRPRGPASNLAKLRVMFAWAFMPRVTLWGGPTFNVHNDDPRDGNGRPGYGWTAYTWVRSETRVRLWPGFVAGVRF